MNTKTSFKGISRQVTAYDALRLSGLLCLPIPLRYIFRIGVSQYNG
jgi:hypothetical protein